MKIALASDIHLEFGDIDLKNTDRADVLILSGDICVATHLNGKNRNRIQTFFERCSSAFSNVIYIMGNHEYYGGDFSTTVEKLREFLSGCQLHNIHILDTETKVIDDVTFIGGTLWTDMNKEDPITIHAIADMMNDFVCVTNSVKKVAIKLMDGSRYMRDAKFSPSDAIEEHKKMIEYIRTVIEGKHDQKYVVVGHHGPSKASVHPRFRNERDHIINGGYSSELSEFILDHPQIKVWTHGHTHDKFDYMIGSTRVICNPRGYANYEQSADTFKLEYFEV